MKTFTSTFARILFAIPFFVFGLMHFFHGAQLATMLKAWPASLVWVYIAGAGFILASIAMIINRYARLAAFLLALEILIITLFIHVPGLSNPEMMQLNFSQLLKNIGLIAGALMVAGFSKN